jgi:hypothetical protein
MALPQPQRLKNSIEPNMTVHPLPLVRLAQPVDEDAIIDMCRRLHKENGLFSLNEDKVRTCLRKCFNREGVVVGVIGMPGELQASTCLQFSDFYYTNDWHLAELWNFVEEPYRNTRNAEALIEFGKACSRDMQMPLFTGIITNKQMAGKVRLYRRLFGYPVGAFFLYNGNWKSEPMEDHSDLRQKLRDAAFRCANNKIRSHSEIAELASLLKKAAERLGSEGNIWGSSREKRESVAPANH